MHLMMYVVSDLTKSVGGAIKRTGDFPQRKQQQVQFQGGMHHKYL